MLTKTYNNMPQIISRDVPIFVTLRHKFRSQKNVRVKSGHASGLTKFAQSCLFCLASMIAFTLCTIL